MYAKGDACVSAPGGDRRGERGLWLVFFFIITEANNSAANLWQQLNVIDFNLTAGLHTFVWEVCCTRKASLCICRHTSCVCSWGFCSPSSNSMVVLRNTPVKDLCSFIPNSPDIYGIWCHYRPYLVHKALVRRASGRWPLPLILKCHSWRLLDYKLHIMHFIKSFDLDTPGQSLHIHMHC